MTYIVCQKAAEIVEQKRLQEKAGLNIPISNESLAYVEKGRVQIKGDHGSCFLSLCRRAKKIWHGLLNGLVAQQLAIRGGISMIMKYK